MEFAEQQAGTAARPPLRRAGALLAVAVGLAAAASSCADRARAGPVVETTSPTAVDLAAVVESPEGRLELRAARATLDPGFPDRVAGAFDEASLTVVPVASAAAHPPAAPDGGPADRPAVSSDPAAAGPASPTDDAAVRDFSVRARRMRYDARGGRAAFSGDVAVTLGPLRLACDALEVIYHRAEGYVDFVAAGGVRAEREGLRATAGKAQYQGADGLLTLTESPRVEGDAGVLEGARIVLDIAAETVSIEEVRGTFRVRPP